MRYLKIIGYFVIIFASYSAQAATCSFDHKGFYDIDGIKPAQFARIVYSVASADMQYVLDEQGEKKEFPIDQTTGEFNFTVSFDCSVDSSFIVMTQAEACLRLGPNTYPICGNRSDPRAMFIKIEPGIPNSTIQGGAFAL